MSAPNATEARRMLEEGHPAEALSRFLALAESEPTRPSHPYMVGRCLLALKRTEEAVLWFERALTIWEGMSWARLRLAECRMLLGHPEEVEEELACLTPPGNRPEDLLLHRQASVLRVKAREASGDLPGAVEAARVACDLDPDNAFRHYHLGKLLLGTGQPEEAETQLRTTLRLDSRLDYAADALARALAARGEIDRARETFCSVRVHRRPWYVHLHFARFLEERGEKPLARLEVTASLFRQPRQNPGAHFLLGRLLAEAGHPAEARHCLQTARRQRQEAGAADFPEAAQAEVALGSVTPRPPALWLPARVSRLDDAGRHGFAVTASGAEVFFHSRSVQGRLPEPGTDVECVPALDLRGLSAVALRHRR